TSINGSVGLLLSDRVGPLSDRALLLLRIAQSETDRLIRLINDILDIRKIELGKFELKLEHLETANVVTNCMEAISGFANAHEIELEAEILSNVTVNADRDRLTQVMTNLVSNAIKFSPDNGTVKIRCEQKGNRALFSMIDQGRGIPPDQLHKLFGMFQ